MDINLIKYAPLFSSLDEREQAILAEGFISGQLDDGSTLFRAGEQSEALYLLSKGFVKLTTDTGTNLATLGVGSVLGEASSFRNAIQDVTAIASTEIEYWRLSDQKLREIVLQNPSIGIKLGKSFGSMLAQMEDYLVVRLSDTVELGDLPRHTLQAIASRLQGLEVSAGQPLIQSGEAANGLFLLESGTVSVQNPDSGTTDTVGSGSILGALALLTSKPQIQNVVANSDGMVWVLSADDFQSLNTEHRALRRSLGKNVQARLAKADQVQAATRLQEMPIFSDLPMGSIESIAQRMILRHISAGERVYRVGDGGDALYLIESGEIELTAENASGVIEELARIGNQGFFGEMSLLAGQIRTEDATATRNTNLWVLYKGDLDSLGVEDNSIRSALNQGLAARLASEESESEQNFRNFELLSELGSEELHQVVSHLKPTRYRAGENVVRISTPGDALFLIENGEVRVQTFNGGSWLLGPGESFGEQSLLTNQPHNASISAQTDVDLWSLSKVDFDSLLTQYPGLAISLSRMLSQRLSESNAYAPSQDASPAQPSPASAIGSGPAEARTAVGQQNDAGFQSNFEPNYQSSFEEPQGTAPFNQQQFPQEAQMQGGGFNPLTPAGQPAPQAARQRRANAAQHMSPRQRMGFGQWFSSLSGFAKLRFALIILLLIWLFGIALPYMFLSMIQGPGVASGASLPVSVSGSLAAVYSLGSYEVAAQDRDSAMEIALRDRLVSPTPTHTPPPTATPMITPTPKRERQVARRKVAAPSSEGPSFIRGYVNVAEQALRLAPAAPAEAAPAAAPAEPAPSDAAPALGRALDPRLGALGVRIEDANVAPGQPYWRIIEVEFWDEEKSAGKHHLYADVLDEAGNRVVGHPVKVVWAEGEHTGPVENKPFPELGFNYQMYAAGYAYSIQADGLPSDKLIGAGLGSVEQRFYGIHTSYLVIFQKAIR